LRRLVLVRERRAVGEPIQNIPFRLGLNIIDTPESPPEETRTVGHNVGKTLFVRLIRYCLGDRNLANRQVRFQVQNLFPEGYALAEVIIAGTCWAVARPLGRGRPSWAVPGGAWEDLLGDSASFPTYDGFREAVEQATVAPLQGVELPHERRPPAWTDLLGWLARDQRCRFRHHNEWRESDMDSGSACLKFEDANLLTRVVMGVLAPQERQLAARLDGLRHERKQAEEEHDGLQRSITHTRSHLMHRLGLPLYGSLGRLFANIARQKVEALQQQLQEDLAEIIDQVDLERFEAERLRAERELGTAEGQASQMQAQRDWVEAQLGQAEAGQRTSVVSSLVQQLKCPHPECPLGHADRPPGTSDPLLAARVAELREELRRIDEERSQQARRVAGLQEAERGAAERLRRCREDYEQRMRALQARNGQYLLLGEQVEEYESDVGKYEAAVEKCNRLATSIITTQGERSAMLGRHQRQFAALNDYFGRVLRQLLPDARGSLVLDNRIGLSPQTDDATGEAIGTAGMVIGFDLACLVAGTAGVGQHPRFLIHDSPREADLERTAYYRLFRWAVELEQAFAGQPPFQYILTTITPPPPALAGAPYVCLTLDAREERGLLLKARF
jgi:hypothetical protein